MNDILSVTNLTMIEYSSAVIIINIIGAFFLSLIISYAYQKTHRGISYSQSFVISLVMMSVLSAIAMMILGNNIIRALGILGVFTLLRFRTIIKDTRDATFLFFSLAIGMAVGTNNYVIATIGTFMLSAISYILFKFNYGSVVREGYLFTLLSNEDFDAEAYKDVFAKYLSAHKVLQIKAKNDHSGEYYFSVRFKDKTSKDEFVASIQAINGVVSADLVSSRDAAEY